MVKRRGADRPLGLLLLGVGGCADKKETGQRRVEKFLDTVQNIWCDRLAPFYQFVSVASVPREGKLTAFPLLIYSWDFFQVAAKRLHASSLRSPLVPFHPSLVLGHLMPPTSSYLPCRPQSVPRLQGVEKIGQACVGEGEG